MTRTSAFPLTALLFAVISSGCCSLFTKPAADNVVASREYCNDGLCALQQDKLLEAETLFEQALQVCPYDERAHRHYADTLWRSGRATEALHHMQEAVRLGGDDPEVLVELGQMHLAKQNWSAAAQAARRALAKQRELGSAWALLADIDRGVGNPRAALAHYHRAIACGDQTDRVRYAVADIYTQIGRDDRALATLNALSEGYTPENEPLECLQGRGLAMHRLGRYREAADCLQIAAARGDAPAELLVQLSESQWMAGDPAAARRTIAQALDTRPGFAPALRLAQRFE